MAACFFQLNDFRDSMWLALAGSEVTLRESTKYQTIVYESDGKILFVISGISDSSPEYYDVNRREFRKLSDLVCDSKGRLLPEVLTLLKPDLSLKSVLVILGPGKQIGSGDVRYEWRLSNGKVLTLVPKGDSYFMLVKSNDGTSELLLNSAFEESMQKVIREPKR